MEETLKTALEEVSTAHACERLSIYWNLVFAVLALLSSIFTALAIYFMDIILITSLLVLLRILVLGLANTEEISKRVDALAHSAQHLISQKFRKRYSLILLSSLFVLALAYLSLFLKSKILALFTFELANLLLYLALTPKPYSVAGTEVAFLLSLPSLLASAFSERVPSLAPFILVIISDLGYILSINVVGVKECVNAMKSIES